MLNINADCSQYGYVSRNDEDGLPSAVLARVKHSADERVKQRCEQPVCKYG